MKDKNYEDLNTKKCRADSDSKCYIISTAGNILLEEPIPPHDIDQIQGLIENSNNRSLQDKMKDGTMTEAFYEAQNKAKKFLPNKKENYPTIEIFYKDDNNAIQRLSKDSFQVIAIQKVLANKVQIPNDQEQINFDNAEKRIYVVPEIDIYKEYKKQHIPVIFYPNLDPEELAEVYTSAPEAIKTLDDNRKKQLIKEQAKIAKEIANTFKN